MAYTAIADRPAGLIPHRHSTGGTIRASAYKIADGYGSNIFNGDPVKSSGSNREINVAAAGDTLLGVFAGCQYVNTSGEVKFSRYWPASTSVQSNTEPVAYVYDDPNIEFRCQGDGSIAKADVGARADIVYTAGDTTNGQSAVELDSSDIGTGDQLKIQDIVQRPDNDYGTNTEIIVTIDEHERRAATSEV